MVKLLVAIVQEKGFVEIAAALDEDHDLVFRRPTTLALRT
jgi:hypothetical protein